MTPTTDSTDLLVRRTRAGLGVILACVLPFALADLNVDRDVLAAAYALKGLHVGVIGLLALALRGSASRRRALAVAFVAVNVTYCLTAIGDVLKGHLDTTPLLGVVTSLTAAALLPWGVKPQLATAAVIEVGNLWTLGLTGRPLGRLVDPAAAVTAVLGVSVYVTLELERYRTERQRAEAALAERVRLETLRADVRVSPRGAGSLHASLQACADALVRHLDAAFARIWTLADGGRTLELQASAGMYTHLDGHHARVPVGQFKIGRIAERREPHMTNSVLTDPHVSDREWARREGIVAFAGHPLLFDDRLVGVVAFFARHALSPSTLEALASVADAIAAHVGRARAEKALAHVIEQLEGANRLKGEFVSTMSHELRTPLNVILGYADMLDDPAYTDRKAALDRIRHASRELLELIEATLDLNRLESGRDELHLEAIALGDLWEDLRAEFAALPRQPEVTLTWGPTNGLVLTSDRRKLKIIVKNLVGNALKFTRHGGVHVECQAGRERCALVVRDTGIGIPSEQVAHVFDMFRQVDSSDRRSHGGVGLGLYIVRRLSTQLGGEVGVESVTGRGSTFTVTLPLAGPARRAA